MTHDYRLPRVLALTDAAVQQIQSLEPAAQQEGRKIECLLVLWNDGNYDILAQPDDELVQYDLRNDRYLTYQVPPGYSAEPLVTFTSGEVPGKPANAFDPTVQKLTSKNKVKATQAISFNALTECSYVCGAGGCSWRC